MLRFFSLPVSRVKKPLVYKCTNHWNVCSVQEEMLATCPHHLRPKIWIRYVDDTFTVLHEYAIEDFTLVLDTLDRTGTFTYWSLLSPQDDNAKRGSWLRNISSRITETYSLWELNHLQQVWSSSSTCKWICFTERFFLIFESGIRVKGDREKNPDRSVCKLVTGSSWVLQGVMTHY